MKSAEADRIAYVTEAQRLRAEIRKGALTGPTAGLAAGVAQANLVIALEEEFGLTITDDEAMNLESFSAAWRPVAKAAG